MENGQAPTEKKKPTPPQKKVALSEELAAFMGEPTATRPEVVKKLWVHIKANKCQDPNNGQMIVPDAVLAPLIGDQPVHMTKMMTPLAKHFPKKPKS